MDTETRVEMSSNHYNMMVSTKDLSVHSELCSDPKCHLSCKLSECRVCYHCLTDEDRLVLKDAVIEFNSKWNTRRLIPSTFASEEEYDEHIGKSEANKRHYEWFRGKCDQNDQWC